ncbi:hypothetical protein NECAME_04316 [Necator americanus]|uniref:Tyrosinase copper-binding domain-containing protein n=1 Tax=Necator americanus TaxID=51031 RepID=W2SUY7_NECAM|nr:hypothetical protein NECAME_04316 [Necator americanus]ETN73318.1 hypothetical protein NECAME_04316 [Necator americanus]
MWSDELLGNGNGYVKTGPFKNWDTNVLMPLSQIPVKQLYRVSPNDPMFYLHHAFVDYLWEQFRKQKQTREERETQWATDTCNSLHGYDEQMKPFRLQNRDGLSNQYTDDWLVVLGGNCTGFEGTAICHNSVCHQNRCQLPPRVLQSMRHRKSVDFPAGENVWTKTLLLDQNGKGD